MSRLQILMIFVRLEEILGQVINEHITYKKQHFIFQNGPVSKKIITNGCYEKKNFPKTINIKIFISQ